MTIIGGYVFRVICASLICSILSGLARECFFKKQMQLLIALFLSLTILMPICTFEFPDLEKIIHAYRTDGETAAAAGALYLQKSQQDIIIRESEAYILSKAAVLGADLNVSITLTNTEPPLPETVTFFGIASKEVQQILADTAEKDLGIPKEQQIWRTELESSR